MTNEAGEGAALSAEDEDAIRLALAARPRPRNPPINYPHAAALLLAEIDRLRAALTASERQVHGWHVLAGMYSQLEPELVEVRAERDAARAQLAAQQAVNERLRAAAEPLENALSWLLFWVDKYSMPRRATEASTAADEARSLLSPQRYGYPDPRRKRFHWRHMTLAEAAAVNQDVALLSGGEEQRR